MRWAGWDGRGAEELALRWGLDGGMARGEVRGPESTLRYELRWDGRWSTREVHAWETPAASLHLFLDGEGRWRTAQGKPLPGLAGCRDVDLMGVVFTNTLAIRRLGLAPGQAAELEVAYVAVPGLAVRRARQRYTCLARTRGGARYRYEGLGTGFGAVLAVDPDGLVLDYPGLARRAA